MISSKKLYVIALHNFYLLLFYHHLVSDIFCVPADFYAVLTFIVSVSEFIPVTVTLLTQDVILMSIQHSLNVKTTLCTYYRTQLSLASYLRYEWFSVRATCVRSGDRTHDLKYSSTLTIPLCHRSISIWSFMF